MPLIVVDLHHTRNAHPTVIPELKVRSYSGGLRGRALDLICRIVLAVHCGIAPATRFDAASAVINPIDRVGSL
jgi:hypothetical protein